MRTATWYSGLSLVLAFCGLTYEFVLAQSLSILLGNSVTQFALTIGLFLAGMGVGSARAEKVPAGVERQVLVNLQLALASLVPAAFVTLWWLAPLTGQMVAAPFAYFLAFAVGGLTGMELPLLIQSASRDSTPARMLAFDYAGMLLACLAFPLFFLPQWGIFKTLFVIALLNGLVALAITLRGHRRGRIAPILLCASLLIMVLTEGSLRHWLSQNFIHAAL